MSRRHKLANINYKKIWIEHNGPLPKDENGKNFHVHHIDGNPFNNDITNLMAVSAAEHARIHAKDFVLWASRSNEFITEDGKKRRTIKARESGKKAAANKIGIHNPDVRKKTAELNAKHWRIISPSRNLDIRISNLNKWCKENGISRSGLNCAYLRNVSYNDYYLLQVDKDNSIKDKYKLKYHKNSRTHKIENENGVVIEITNLVNWCKENNVNREGLKTSSYRNVFYKGFKIISLKKKI